MDEKYPHCFHRIRSIHRAPSALTTQIINPFLGRWPRLLHDAPLALTVQWSADRGQEYHQGNMIDEKLLGRITANPEIFGGKPIIRGMRISVEMILTLLAQGE